jgi:hypothetical protein
VFVEEINIWMGRPNKKKIALSNVF